MRILLTGSTGFVGLHVVHELIKRGHDVTVILRSASSARKLAGMVEGLTCLTADLQNDAELNLRGAEPEILLHLAWYCEPHDYRTSIVNTEWPAASMRLLSAAHQAGCRRVLMLGTCFEYSGGRGLYCESAALAPINLYAASKTALHLLASKYCDEQDISLAWLRPFYLYGPHENPNRLVPYVVNHLLAGSVCPLTLGDQVRDFLHVGDVASAICDTAMSGVEGPVNVGSAIPITVSDIALEIGEQIGRLDLVNLGAQPTPVGDPPFICADNSKLLRETDWRPRFDLKSGLADAIAWWQEHRLRA